MLILIFLLVLAVAGCASESDTPNNTNAETTANTETTVSNKSDAGKSNLLTGGTWAITESGYVFAIEVDSYSGDIYEAGKYRFYPSAVSSVKKGEMIQGYTQMVWDIYVSDNLYNHKEDLSQDEYAGTVGGINQDEITVELKKGNYVYINCIDVYEKPLGILSFEKE